MCCANCLLQVRVVHQISGATLKHVPTTTTTTTTTTTITTTTAAASKSDGRKGDVLYIVCQDGAFSFDTAQGEWATLPPVPGGELTAPHVAGTRCCCLCRVLLCLALVCVFVLLSIRCPLEPSPGPCWALFLTTSAPLLPDSPPLCTVHKGCIWACADYVSNKCGVGHLPFSVAPLHLSVRLACAMYTYM